MARTKSYSIICEYCHKPYTAHNKTAKFCSDGCRVMKWKIKNNIPIPDWTFKQIYNRIPSKTELELTTRIKELDEIDNKIREYDNNFKSKLDNEIKKYLDYIEAAKKDSNNTYPLIAQRNEYEQEIVNICKIKQISKTGE